MPDPGEIRIADYNYPLPPELIAQFPLPSRDASGLLVCNGGNITRDVFSNIDRYLPENGFLVFNDTRVIRARLLFTKSSGATIEIFCLEPLSPFTEIEKAFHQPSGCTWKCLVGNLKRWKNGILVHETSQGGTPFRLFAEYSQDCGDGSHIIEFHWTPPEQSFSGILELSGLVPLPPYIHRGTELLDSERYQTVYAMHEGSVAAPTAGLHFTEAVLRRLADNGILTDRLTLHVGVGTFKPVSAERIADHVMHHERIVVSKKTITNLVDNLHRPVIAVGTTSARTLESLYWIGCRLIMDGNVENPGVSQWEPYRVSSHDQPETARALEAVVHYLEDRRFDEYSGETQLMIVPGYRYRVISGLITNFHMPQSTLLLLVAALVGDDWRRAYDYAIAGGFRFLSYGDSCLFLNPV